MQGKGPGAATSLVFSGAKVGQYSWILCTEADINPGRAFHD